MEGLSSNGVMGFADGGGNGGLFPMMFMADQNPFFISQQNPTHARIFKNNEDDNEAEKNRSDIKAKIMCHPLYPRLLTAYIGCHKVQLFQRILGLGSSAFLSPRMMKFGAFPFPSSLPTSPFCLSLWLPGSGSVIRYNSRVRVDFSFSLSM